MANKHILRLESKKGNKNTKRAVLTTNAESINLVSPKDEFAQVDLGDIRRTRVLMNLVESKTRNIHKTIRGMCKASKDTKSYYRLLSNDNLDLEEIMNKATTEVIKRLKGSILFIQDTTDINLNSHKGIEGLGYCSEHVKGVKLHSCLAVTPEGIPLDIAYQYASTREEAKNPMPKDKRKHRPIEEKESFRWIQALRKSTSNIPADVHPIMICDREGDFYELYAEAIALEEDFIVRAVQDRKTATNTKVLTQLRTMTPTGVATIDIPRNSHKGTLPRQATVNISHIRATIKKPTTIHNENIPSELTLNFVRIAEINAPGNSEAIEWVIATNLPINSHEDVMDIANKYTQRWKIERFHYVLKSGLGAEKIQQREYEKVVVLLFLYSVIASYVLALTYLGRISPEISCDCFLDLSEWKMLYVIVHKVTKAPEKPYTIGEAIKYLGILGRGKRAPSDGPPGVKCIWEGLFKLYNAIDCSWHLYAECQKLKQNCGGKNVGYD